VWDIYRALTPPEHFREFHRLHCDMWDVYRQVPSTFMRGDIQSVANDNRLRCFIINRDHLTDEEACARYCPGRCTHATATNWYCAQQYRSLGPMTQADVEEYMLFLAKTLEKVNKGDIVDLTQNEISSKIQMKINDIVVPSAPQ
jgi:hypothetical protein